MRSLPVADAEAIPDRRKRGRRASDLDGAYNDGSAPSPLRLSNGMGLYGGIVWIVVTSGIGTFFILRSAWSFLSAVISHG